MITTSFILIFYSIPMAGRFHFFFFFREFIFFVDGAPLIALSL